VLPDEPELPVRLASPQPTLPAALAWRPPVGRAEPADGQSVPEDESFAA